MPNLLLGVTQQAALFALGVALLGLHIRGSVLAMSAIALMLAIVVISFGMAVTALCRSALTMNAVTNVAAVFMAGLGGAFVPIATLPAWAQATAPTVPTYWAMRGYRAVILQGAGIADVLLPVGVLAGFAIVFGLTALVLFSADEAKAGLE